MPQSITETLQQGPASSKELQDASGLSQRSVSRHLKEMGGHIVVMKDGRTPKYALTTNAFGSSDNLPLFAVDASGNSAAIAKVRPLAHGGFYVDPLPGMPAVLLGEDGNGFYDDLPYFLMDLSPQGFIGRQIAADLSSRSDDFPSDPKNWNSNHIGRYLVSNGDDLPGNFQFGEQAHLRVRRQPVVSKIEDYPGMADRVMEGGVPGSSAGGEQPKFTAYCGERLAHVIVKFSPRGDDRVSQRWRDVLITEHYAAKVINAAGFPAAETRLVEADGRLFLESKRFDRVGEHGRMPQISLESVDAEFTGLGSGWPAVMRALHDKKLISWQHAFDAMVLWMFGRLINNTDMHLGNLALGIEGDVFRLLPIYDMCSMGFAPKSGEVQQYKFTLPDASQLLATTRLETSPSFQMALTFWEEVATDDRISDEFREFLKANSFTLEQK